jgi:thioredoxin reductase
MNMKVIQKADLVIIGGGPAGMCAAIEARKAGVGSVLVLDEGPSLGGQIFRRYGKGFSVSSAREAGHEYSDGEKLIKEARASGAEFQANCTVWGVWDKIIAYVTDDEVSQSVEARAIIVATGARDRPVAFPGWTLPGVYTAGAGKTMVAIQRVLPGRRTLMAGSGPLALAFSAQLRGYGANIVEVAEAAERPGLSQLTQLALYGDPSILRDAAGYRLSLLRDHVPFSYRTVIVRALGVEQVTGAVLSRVDRNWRVIPNTERTVEVDSILLGYGLESSSEIVRLMGCNLHFSRDEGGWLPVKDTQTRTSLPLVFAAGDGSGVGGSKFAMAEGRIAGITAALDLGVLSQKDAATRSSCFHRRLGRMRKFRDVLNKIYHVGPGLFEIADKDTLVCRCEERTMAELDQLLEDGVTDPNVVRARSRIGMGRCQARNCGSNVAARVASYHAMAIADVQPMNVRPPAKPIQISTVASEREQHEAPIELE